MTDLEKQNIRQALAQGLPVGQLIAAAIQQAVHGTSGPMPRKDAGGETDGARQSRRESEETGSPSAP